MNMKNRVEKLESERHIEAETLFDKVKKMSVKERTERKKELTRKLYAMDVPKLSEEMRKKVERLKKLIPKDS